MLRPPEFSLALDSGGLRQVYLRGEPFPHLVADTFLPETFVEELLREFPSFDAEFALSENGVAEGKMVRSTLRDFGDSFRKLDLLLRSESFLRLVEGITQIQGLIFDPTYFGGGIHCSKPGQELDPHVDFNLHPIEEHWLRRVNVLLYLNPQWNEERGGNLELHSDPRNPGNIVRKISPLANRLVIFETNETSWHGHDRILPGAGDPTRKSVAAYYYVDARKVSATIAPHHTIYVDRPLSGEESTAELGGQAQKRKTHLGRLLRTEEELLGTVTRLNKKLQAQLDTLARNAEPAALESHIVCMDLRISEAYEREKELRQSIERHLKEISILEFLCDGE